MIAILIVGYKSKNDLSECLGSIYGSSYKKFRVFFLDNFPDGSVEYIKTNYPKVEIVANEKNLGYAGGNNKLIKKAIEQKAEYIFVLNPDTIIDPECLKMLASKANNSTILQPLLLIHNGKKKTNLINSAGNILNFLGFSYCGDYKINRKEIVNDKNIALASGAAIFIPSKIIKKIGSYDESFFMYHEDVDLNWRARIFGYNIKLIKDAVVWHKYSFSRNKNKMFYAERNRLLFLYKNFSLKYLLLILPAFIINEILVTVYAIFAGWGMQKLKATFTAIKMMPSEKKQRKLQLAKIKQRQSEMKKLLSSKIAFSELSNSFIFWPYNVTIGFYWKLIRLFI